MDSKDEHYHRKQVLIFSGARDLFDAANEMILNDRTDDPDLIKAVNRWVDVVNRCFCQQSGFDPDLFDGECPLCGCDPTFFCDLHRDMPEEMLGENTEVPHTWEGSDSRD